jgi:hypothetical protein
MADRQPILSAVKLALDEPPGPTGHLAARSSPGGLLAAPLPIDTAQNAPVSPRSKNAPGQDLYDFAFTLGSLGALSDTEDAQVAA